MTNCKQGGKELTLWVSWKIPTPHSFWNLPPSRLTNKASIISVAGEIEASVFQEQQGYPGRSLLHFELFGIYNLPKK